MADALRFMRQEHKAEGIQMFRHDRVIYVRNLSGDFWCGFPRKWDSRIDKGLKFSSPLSARLDARPVESEGIKLFELTADAELIEVAL